MAYNQDRRQRRRNIEAVMSGISRVDDWSCQRKLDIENSRGDCGPCLPIVTFDVNFRDR